MSYESRERGSGCPLESIPSLERQSPKLPVRIEPLLRGKARKFPELSQLSRLTGLECSDLERYEKNE